MNWEKLFLLINREVKISIMKIKQMIGQNLKGVISAEQEYKWNYETGEFTKLSFISVGPFKIFNP